MGTPYMEAMQNADSNRTEALKRQLVMQQMAQAAQAYQTQQAQQQRVAQARGALGNMLPELAQMGRPPDAQAPQPPPPGAPSVPMMPPGGAPPPGQMPSPPPAGGAPGAPPMPQGAGPGAPKPMNGPPGAPAAAGGPPMPAPGWKSLPKPPDTAPAGPGGIPPPPEDAVMPKQLISVADLSKLLAAKGIKGEQAMDMIEQWKPFMDTQNKAELDAMKVTTQAQQAALRAYAAVIQAGASKERADTGAKRVEQNQPLVEAKVKKLGAGAGAGGGGGGASKMSDNAVDDAATQFRKTGVIPSAFRDKESRAIVQNRAAEQRRELGTTAEGEVGDRIDLKAVQSAYTSITKDLAAIRPYKEMLDKNADIAIDLAKKAIATDSKLANRTINWVKQNASDNPNVAEFLAQVKFVQTEAARVLNNPRLVGQLTDSARHEMQEVINGDMPLNSLERVLQRVKKDGENRVAAMTSEADELKKRASGGADTKSSPKSKGDYVELRTTADGRTLGKKADGTIEVVK